METAGFVARSPNGQRDAFDTASEQKRGNYLMPECSNDTDSVNTTLRTPRGGSTTAGSGSEDTVLLAKHYVLMEVLSRC